MASAQVWSKRVAAWRASGQSADEYALGRGFAGATLRWWSSRLGREATRAVHEERPTTEVRMARVVRAAAPPATMGIVVELGGARVLVPAGADRATLEVVLAALGGAS
jgi:hypothetical protein